jgi:hypothetical protein
MPPPSPRSAADAAAAAERLLSRTLLVAGAVLLLLFFLPWVIKGSRWIFAWQLIRGGSLGRTLFLLWIPIAGVNLLALAMLPWRQSGLRAAIAVAVGAIPIAILCATRLTFGQPPAAVPETTGYGLLAAMPLLAFGLHHRAAHRESRVARSAVALGAALVVASFFIPRETQAGTVLPLSWLLERASHGVGWMGVAIYLVLPIPLALLSLAALSARPGWDRPLAVLRWYFLRFIPGLFLLLSFPAFFGDRGEVYRPYVLFVGAATTAYLGCVVAGASAWLAHACARRRSTRP